MISRAESIEGRESIDSQPEVRRRAFDGVFLKRLFACVAAFGVTSTTVGTYLIDRAGDRADQTSEAFFRQTDQVLVDAKAIGCSTGTGLIINLDIVTMGPLRDQVADAGNEIAGLNDSTGVLAEAFSGGETTTTTQPQEKGFDPLTNPLVDESALSESFPQVSNPEFEKPCPPITTTTLPPQE